MIMLGIAYMTIVKVVFTATAAVTAGVAMKKSIEKERTKNEQENG